MGQCVDPLAIMMLSGQWDLVRTIEIKPLVRTRIGRLQADGAWWYYQSSGWLDYSWYYGFRHDHIHWWGRTISLVRNGI